MTREDAILWMTVLKQSKINWIGDTNKIDGIKAECEKAEQEAFDIAIEALRFVEHFDLLKEYQSLQEVVWCKDCRFAQDDITHLYCDYFGHKTYEDDFCSHGECKGGDAK